MDGIGEGAICLWRIMSVATSQHLSDQRAHVLGSSIETQSHNNGGLSPRPNVPSANAYHFSVVWGHFDNFAALHNIC